MPGPNATGKPNTSDYQLGRGILYFSALDASTGIPKGGWRDMGNAPEFTITASKEVLQHFSSRTGLKVLDKEVVISQTMTFSFGLDECNHENMADFFSGEKATHTNAGIAGFAEYVMVADGDAVKGRWYDLKNSTNGRAYDVDPTKLVVKTNEASPVTLVLNTDYELDVDMGRIFLLSTSAALATSITAGKGIRVSMTADVGAAGVNEVRAFTKTSIAGALKFISENPAGNGYKTELQFHQVTLKASGDFSLIGDDWTQMTFEGAAEKNANASPNSPTLTIRNLNTASGLPTG